MTLCLCSVFVFVFDFAFVFASACTCLVLLMRIQLFDGITLTHKSARCMLGPLLCSRSRVGNGLSDQLSFGVFLKIDRASDAFAVIPVTPESRSGERLIRA